MERKKIAFVARAWFPDHQILLERIQLAMPDVTFYYVLLSGVEAGRSWVIHDSPLNLVNVPHLKINLFGKEAVFNYGVRRILDRLTPDLVIVTPWSELGIFSSIRWAVDNNVPCIGLAVGPRFFHWSLFLRVRSLFSRFIIKLFVSQISELMVYGESVRSRLQELVGPVNCRVTVTKHSVDDQKFVARTDPRVLRFRREFLRRYSELNGRPVIGYVGQLIARKGVEQFLSALERLVSSGWDVSALVIGRGPLSKSVNEFSARFPGRLVLISHLPDDDFRYIYGVMDLVALPSLFEDWGHVVNEALLCETAIIASSGVYSARELLRNDHYGVLYSVDNPGALYEALRDALRNIPEMSRKASEGRAFLMDHWNLDISTKIWVSRLEAYISN